MQTTVLSDSEITGLYPPSPANVPNDLREPSRAYLLRAWFAVLGLGAFFAVYVALTGWFAWIAYHLIFHVLAGGDGGLGAVAVALGAILLAIFMVRALFFVKRSAEVAGTEITELEQPLLFAFLHRLAAEVGAPRPYRVYLSSRVNAAVFYDLSILNLLWPSRRNLEIGLGLVNVLTLTELKAVIAHEYGHFAQRSLVVGRWVYISAQIAGHLVTKRDALDRLSQQLTRFIPLNPIGLLLMAFGWTMRLTVWSIRSVTDATFRLLVIVQRALSREMEFQADLVAVSVTGSDPLVHALHKMPAAEDAWKRAWVFAGSELKKGKRVPDVFALQSAAIERLRTVLGMPDFGRTPAIADSDRGSYRLFKARFAQPPKMWMTHPPSFEREENCKRRYVAAHDNNLEAWALFKDSEGLRARSTTAGLQSETAVGTTREESVLAFERSFDRPYLDRAYQGVYLGRTLTRSVNDPKELLNAAGTQQLAGSEISALYPASLGADAELQRNLAEEYNGLQAIKKGTMMPPDGVIRYRGRAIGRSELNAALDSSRADFDAVSLRIADHDRQCRSAHLAAAAQAGAGWDAYLVGLMSMLHYAEHTEANLLDARGYLVYSLATVTRQGKIAAKDVPLVVDAARPVHLALKEAFDQRAQVVFDPLLAERFGAAAWPLQNTQFELVAPVTQNVAAWLKVIDSWVGTYIAMFQQLRFAALDQLLAMEAKVAQASAQMPLPQAPAPSQVPTDFTRRPVGTERERNLDVDWLDRWQSAGGPIAAVSRLLIALSLIIAVSLLGLNWGSQIDSPEQFARGLKAQKQAARPSDYISASASYKKAADQGNAGAQNNLAVLYAEGKGVDKDPVRAFELFRKSAEQGDTQAQSNLGSVYLNGVGVARDYTAALTWLQRAADKGNAAAQYNLSVMYQSGLGVKADPKKSLEWLRKAAEQGLGQAENNLGVHLANGDGVAKDEAQAAAWYRKAADQKYAMAQANLGMLYSGGIGVAKDDAQALSLLQQSAGQGNARGQFGLGLLYASGRGVAKDYTQAALWYRKAADQGLAPAQYSLGTLYTLGFGVPKDPEQAFAWKIKAAQQNIAAAQNDVAFAYEKGVGVERDETKAAAFYQKAADQGNAVAQNNLGLMYLNGSGTYKDPNRAFTLFRKSIAQGNIEAQCNLGVLYAKGLGVEKDEALAVNWFRKAAEGGLPRAQGLLGMMYADGRGVPKDLAAAQTWLTKGANGGDQGAQLMQGISYENGLGVPKDQALALAWYRKAAQQGNAAARERADKLSRSGGGASQ
jgi:TPR repeat protein/Zn-dependent protease with chaperone function